MNAIRQKCRPKHQLLILKCYPRLPKNTTATEEIKPNGSELSYLLYYASSRRTKLDKVGTFLEKKTESDVYKGRIPAVLVTLEILAAFVSSAEVCGTKDGFGLFAPYVLRILKEVLEQGGSVEVVEGALPVWVSFCGHQDHATLAGDMEYRSLFASVVKIWAGFAAKKEGSRKTLGRLQHLSASDEIRLRKAGLEAMQAVSQSAALNSEPARQMDTILNVVLQNIWAENGNYLAVLEHREKEHEAATTTTTRGRASIATARTARSTEEGDPRAAQGTTADADKIAEEEAGQLALQVLRGIYQVDNRAQIRLATSSLLAFIAQHGRGSRQSERADHQPQASSWASALVKMVCAWTPVQDRFVVLFTAVENLIRTPILEEEMEKQLVLSDIIGQVLASDTNLIGLSIMDILLGLVQHVLMILQVGTQHAKLSAPEITSSDDSSGEKSASRGTNMEVVKTASPARIQLLAQLRQCIASLATHVYYTDQIADMASAILLRLKPSLSAASTHPTLTASAIANPESAAAEVANNNSLKERPNTDGFFSFDTAREVALNAVKDIMTVANSATVDGSSTANNRNPVPINVWEGTQWLLRDLSNDVRRTYIDALCTWLELETDKSDGWVEDKSAPATHKKENGHGEIARRAVSNASARNRAAKKGRSTFLQLLHLAIYEEALHRADARDADNDFLLLHLLLTTLSEHLGINAVRNGLPMIFRLQEDIKQVPSPQAKIRLGSLVHGYLWSLVRIYNMGSTFVATEIESEIARRKEYGTWLTGIQVPVLPLQQILAKGSSSAGVSAANVSDESLTPFEHRHQLVESLAEAYIISLASPPASPPTSPSRSFSLPLLSDPAALQSSSYLKPGASPSGPSSGNHQIPSVILEELNEAWSKDILLAAIVAAAPKSISLSGSRSGGTGLASQFHHGSRTEMLRTGGNTGVGVQDHRHILAAAATFPMTKSMEGSPTRRSGSAGGPHSSTTGLTAGTGSVRRAATSHGAKQTRLASRSPGGAGGGRRASASTQGNGYGRAPSTRASSIAGQGGSRLEELKRALATGTAGAGMGRLSGAGIEDVSDDDDESMVEYTEGDEYAESSYGDAEDENPVRRGSAINTPPDQMSPANSYTVGGLRMNNNAYSAFIDADAVIAAYASDGDGTPRPALPTLSEVGNREELPAWSAAAMAELNAQGAGIVAQNGDVPTSPDTLSPTALSPTALSPTATSPGATLAPTNGATFGGSRPTTGSSSKRVASKGSMMNFGPTLNVAGRPGSSATTTTTNGGKKDFSGLLDSIGVGEDDGEDMGGITPPY